MSGAKERSRSVANHTLNIYIHLYPFTYGSAKTETRILFCNRKNRPCTYMKPQLKRIVLPIINDKRK